MKSRTAKVMEEAHPGLSVLESSWVDKWEEGDATRSGEQRFMGQGTRSVHHLKVDVVLIILFWKAIRTRMMNRL